MWNDSNGEKMKVEVDFSGLDEFLEDAENEIKQGMIEVAHAGVDYSKETGTTKTIPTTYVVHPVRQSW